MCSCLLLMFRTAAISEICNLNHFCSKPSVNPQHRKNGNLSRNGAASYEWTGRHCTSSMTRHPAVTRQSLGTERLWMARPWSDVRVVGTGLLQPNAASVCNWHTMTVAVTVTALLASDLIVTRTGGATCFVILTCSWNSVSSKQFTVELTSLCSCSLPLFKFAWIWFSWFRASGRL